MARPYPQIAKPRALTELHGVAEALFDVLREAYSVPPAPVLPLHDVDRSGVDDDVALTVVITMWETQNLRRAATPGVPVLNADVVGLAATLAGAISRLAVRHETVDFADLLLSTRTKVNEAAVLATDLGRPHGGIVLMV